MFSANAIKHYAEVWNSVLATWQFLLIIEQLLIWIWSVSDTSIAFNANNIYNVDAINLCQYLNNVALAFWYFLHKLTNHGPDIRTSNIIFLLYIYFIYKFYYKFKKES